MKRFLWAAALAWMPAACWAGNEVANVTAYYHSSLASVAVTSIVNGDDDTTHVCRIFAGLNSASDSGMVMVRRVNTNICEGRILFMGRDDEVKVQVEVNDQGAKRRTPQMIVTVARVPGLPAGERMYVSQATGNNANSGLTIGSPKRTLNTNAAIDGGAPGAVQALMARPDSGAHGVIVCLGRNEFHERIDLTWGRDGKPRGITGDPSDRGATIICGANEHGEAGRRDNTNALAWTQEATSGIYRAYLPRSVLGSSYGDSVGSVIIGLSEYLHRKTSTKALWEDSTGTVSSANLAANGERSGWFWQNDTMYIRRKDRSAPPATDIHFGYRTQLITVAGRNWVIKNLTLRYAGGPLLCDADPGPGTVPCTAPNARNAAEDPPTSGDGIINSRAGNVNASGLVVDSVHVYGCVGLGVYAAYGSATERADSVTVANSIFDGLTIGSMEYRDAKGRNEEDSNILKITGTRCNVYRNVVRGTHNGIQTGPNASPAIADTTWGSHAEVYGNTIHTLSDDAIELDTSYGINTVVWNNYTDNSNMGVSVTPVYRGPLFFFLNTCTRFKSQGVKTGFDDMAIVLFYQNTFASEYPNTSAYGMDVVVGRHRFLNNILMGARAIYDFSATNDDVRFDYSALDSTRGTRLIRWEGVDGLSWTQWQAEGMDANGVYGDLGLLGLNTPVGVLPDVRIMPTSPARRAGVRIPGVNTDFRGPRYTGSAPDIGAQVCLTCARRTQHDR